MAPKRKSFNLLGRRAQNKLIKSEVQISCKAKIVNREFNECEANDSIDTKAGGSGVTNDSNVPPFPGLSANDSNNLMSSCITQLPDFVGIGDVDAGDVDTSNVSDDDGGSVFEESDGNGGIGLSEVKRALRGWAIKHNITNTAVNELLFELRKVDSLSSLPLDARTLLKTGVSAKLRSVAPGYYFHFGLKKGIMNAMKCLEVNPTEIKLLIGIDGLPVAKSSKSQFWPILAHLIPAENSCVFPVGIYHGHEKPGNANDFLRDFVDEAIDLLETGLTLEDSSIIPVKLLGICCDAPAKSFVLCIKGHTGYSSCTRCTIEGKFLNNRICFPGKSGVERTHVSFVGQVDEDYHRGVSILTEIPNFDLVNSFCLDYMHLICLGVMHKLINIWLSGRVSRRFPSRQSQKLSENLLSLRSSIPFEFARRPRGMEEVSRWKATEFRQFLLYTGPVVLSKIGIDGDILLNFMSLHAAMRILLDKESVPSRVKYAQSLLVHFHSSFGMIYGEGLISHNVHNVLHLADDFHRFGALDSCSAFRFENHMQKLKRLIRSPNKPLEQVIRRYSELTYNETEGQKLNHNFPSYSSVHNEGPLLSNCCVTKQYKEVKFQNFRLSTSKPNNVCGLSSGDILVVDNIVYCLKSKEMVVIGRTYQDRDNFYSLPCESSKLGIYKVYNLSNSNFFPVRNIKLKYVQLQLESVVVVIPLLNSSIQYKI
ncbi:uncharacterized protein LOC124169102 isoform X1 [Ischnura elegans]|uniref:uncharacterized protein LOC124169102 isoform X1 n=1 Tax=Ischnura elegans TaxID=197161 RepID=UPI001ED89055|nr:uncharacterized protein LOC124169102 isoform X1 [Ischnura elegans]